MNRLWLLPWLSAGLFAQSPILDGMKREQGAIQAKILAAAEAAPESIYDFKATPEVFSLRRMFLHIAGAQYSICAWIQGDSSKAPKVDEEKSASKAETIQTLKASFGYCGDILNASSDKTLAEMVKTRSGERPKSYYASHLIGHNSLHYGNIVTYLRLNKLKPPE